MKYSTFYGSKDINWFNGEDEKKIRSGYMFRTITLDETTKKKYLELAESLSIRTFCRIDARIKCTEPSYHDQSCNTVRFDDVYFIEINVMPTIREKNNFTFSFDSVEKNDPIFSCIEIQKQIMGSVDIYSFLLASSMLSYT